MAEKKPTKLEALKESSDYLRASFKEALAQDTTHFTGDEAQLLKFHGSYQQDDRDLRQKLAKEKKEKAFSLMVRSKIPGGKMTAEQYLVHDDIATQYGGNKMRITDRQGIQFHGILKRNIKAVIQGICSKLGSTSGACGDIVRNVMACPAPFADRKKAEIMEWAQKVSDQFLSKSGAYQEVWLDGEKVVSQEEPEPIYGKTYLPRKFKIGIAFPGDNSVDVYTQDLGIVPEIENDQLRGFNILVGGGLGMTHNIPSTYPRLATPFCFVLPEDLLAISKAIVLTQRDFGDRTDRKQARMKYLIDKRGIDWFREEVEKRFGKKTMPVHRIKWNEMQTYGGWHEEGDGKWFLGISIENGRVKDEGDFKLKSALRKAVEQFKADVYITATQDVLLSGFTEDQKSEAEAIFKSHGITLPDELSEVQKGAMACPAMPTCGLAISESERVFPDVIDQIEAQVKQLGLEDQKFVIRMTGCPNGCARPYNAEIAFVGKTTGTYNVYVGGSLYGDRLAFLLAEKVPFDELSNSVSPLLSRYKVERKPREGFGDFCARLGQKALQN